MFAKGHFGHCGYHDGGCDQCLQGFCCNAAGNEPPKVIARWGKGPGAGGGCQKLPFCLQELFSGDEGLTQAPHLAYFPPREFEEIYSA